MVVLIEGEFNCRTASDADDVYVTGTFDNWSKSNKLEKTAHGTLEKEVSLPMAEKISYKVQFTRTRVFSSHALPRVSHFPCMCFRPRLTFRVVRRQRRLDN